MLKKYIGLWLLIALAFAGFATYSFLEPVKIGGHTLKQSKLAEHLYAAPAKEEEKAIKPTSSAPIKPTRCQNDTSSKVILLAGDSMLEGLTPRMAKYAHANGHKLYSVIWYSSTTQQWSDSSMMARYVKQLHPDYIFLSLGGNELFVSDIKNKRAECVDNIIKEIGDIPFVWIGPPNWKADTGINDLIRSKTYEGQFFESNGMHFEREKDGAHPTRSSAALWVDSIARWMPKHCLHPIRMKTPAADEPRSLEHQFMHAPVK